MEMSVYRLTYGNTNTYLIMGAQGGLLVDTGYAGTLPAFYQALKKEGLQVRDIAYVMATHYHPDHCGLIGELTRQGVQLLLVDGQQEHVHFADGIFARDRLPYVPVEEAGARVIRCEESRAFLKSLGIDGEIFSTPSHSPDSVSLMLDSGECLVGDLEPYEYLAAYEENEPLRRDWEAVLARHPKRICCAHVNEKAL